MQGEADDAGARARHRTAGPGGEVRRPGGGSEGVGQLGSVAQHLWLMTATPWVLALVGRGWIPRKGIGVVAAARKTRETGEICCWLWVIPKEMLLTAAGMGHRS